MDHKEGYVDNTNALLLYSMYGTNTPGRPCLALPCLLSNRHIASIIRRFECTLHPLSFHYFYPARTSNHRCFQIFPWIILAHARHSACAPPPRPWDALSAGTTMSKAVPARTREPVPSLPTAVSHVANNNTSIAQILSVKIATESNSIRSSSTYSTWSLPTSC